MRRQYHYRILQNCWLQLKERKTIQYNHTSLSLLPLLILLYQYIFLLLFVWVFLLLTLLQYGLLVASYCDQSHQLYHQQPSVLTLLLLHSQTISNITINHIHFYHLPLTSLIIVLSLGLSFTLFLISWGDSPVAWRLGSGLNDLRAKDISPLFRSRGAYSIPFIQVELMLELVAAILQMIVLLHQEQPHLPENKEFKLLCL